MVTIAGRRVQRVYTNGQASAPGTALQKQHPHFPVQFRCWTLSMGTSQTHRHRSITIRGSLLHLAHLAIETIRAPHPTGESSNEFGVAPTIRQLGLFVFLFFSSFFLFFLLFSLTALPALPALSIF
ncbi:hypothetical protein AFCA_013330 [Aspergillus flavus]|nr:hypothetical protein AFCA_013330 [Aspergillus flavus]UDD60318.1 hypothetical protein AFCA_013330 [Aspergillus flavus]